MLRLVSTGAVLAALSLAGCDAPSGSADASGDGADHHYAMQDGDAYGYKAAISDEEESQGVKSKSLIMVRYLGEQGGVYRLAVGTPAVVVTECAKPCKFIKQTNLGDGSVETLPYSPDSIAGVQFDDAETGKLQVSQAAIDEVAKTKADAASAGQ